MLIRFQNRVRSDDDSRCVYICLRLYLWLYILICYILQIRIYVFVNLRFNYILNKETASIIVNSTESNFIDII